MLLVGVDLITTAFVDKLAEMDVPLQAAAVSKKTTKPVSKKAIEIAPTKASAFKEKIVPIGSRWGEVICTVWDKEKRWEYYKNPYIEDKIKAFIKLFGGQRVDTWLISKTKLETNLRALNAGKPKTIDGVPYIKSAFYTTVVSDVTPWLDLPPGEFMQNLHDANNGRGSGTSDIILRVPKNPRIWMLDIDVNVPNKIAINGIKSIKAYMNFRKMNPEIVFSGKTGYHVFYQSPFSLLTEANAFVEKMVKDLNQQKWLRDQVEFIAGIQHPDPGAISIDWSQGSSANKTVVVPFSLRWDSCYASVPVNFDKFPNFDPEKHAMPEYVISHQKQFG